ncbi:hypothetical protein MHU86_25554 [Fragilaria crotonensis]|nr:hypothetical protein MHU86_25554 [Fragilaria crotonensis]
MTLDESPQETLERRIAALQAVHKGEDSWRGVVKGGDPDNFCSKIEIFEIQQGASFLCLAYQLALQKMNQWTWQDCCKEACSRFNDLGMQQATFYRTIAEWNIIYMKLDAFPPKCLRPVWEATTACSKLFLMQKNRLLHSVFAQYLLGAKTWIGPKGQRPLLPKSEGDGYMLSAFVSREFGFGRPLTEDELARINLHRQQSRATYTDTHAAMEILGTINKVALTESPFVKYLFIGANNEGYWNSFYMSLQLEDVVDCLQVLYPEFDLVFLFDHSQGHARKRDQALSAAYVKILRRSTAIDERHDNYGRRRISWSTLT